MGKIKVVILGIGIALVLAFVIGFGVETFYKSPEYEDFCSYDRNPKIIETEESCLAQDGEWTAYEDLDSVKLKNNEFICTKISDDGEEVSLTCRDSPSEQPSGYCDLYSRCQKEYQEAEEPYARNSFIIIIILGLSAVIIGAYLKLQSVSAGIMGGGVLVMLYAAIRFWRNLDEYLRFTILVITLAVLIWIGYKKFKK